MYEYKIKEVTKIYDGDTITVLIDCGFDITVKKTIRLYGIDTPELRGIERPDGLVSRTRLVELMEEYGDRVYIQTLKDKTGKYGRLLGILKVEDSDKTLNSILVEEGFAEPYMV